MTTNSTVRKISDLIKNDVRNVEIELVDIEIMNQLSYHVDGSKHKKNGLSLNAKIEKDVEETLNLFDYLKS